MSSRPDPGSTPQPSNGGQPRRTRAGDLDRDQVINVLQQAHAAGRLSLTEFDQRQDLALRSVYLDQLDQLTDDLPEAQRAVAVGRSPGLAVPTASVPVAQDRGFSISIMSGRDVQLEPGEQRWSNFAWWGGNDIDLTRALGPGRTVELVLTAIMAGSTIVVPPGVRVVDRSIAIMAGNDITKPARGDGSNGTLVLKGFLFWAGNTVALAGTEH